MLRGGYNAGRGGAAKAAGTAANSRQPTKSQKRRQDAGATGSWVRVPANWFRRPWPKSPKGTLL